MATRGWRSSPRKGSVSGAFVGPLGSVWIRGVTQCFGIGGALAKGQSGKRSGGWKLVDCLRCSRHRYCEANPFGANTKASLLWI